MLWRMYFLPFFNDNIYGLLVSLSQPLFMFGIYGCSWLQMKPDIDLDKTPYIANCWPLIPVAVRILCLLKEGCAMQANAPLQMKETMISRSSAHSDIKLRCHSKVREQHIPIFYIHVITVIYT